MRVKILNEHIIAGPDVEHVADGVKDLPRKQALALIRGGYATPLEKLDPADLVEPEPEPETADGDPADGETAALKAKGKKA